MKQLKTIMNKERLNAVDNFVKTSVQIAVPILATIAFSESGKQMLDNIRYSGDVGYDDAVKVIMDSSMFSLDKATMIELLKRDERSEYYKAIISTVKSNMYSIDKIKVVRNMNETN